MSCCNNFDNILYNFISPVTGRVLADYNYVLVGNKQGIAIPSPILIDIRLDLIALRARYNTLVQGDIVIGHPNDQLPNAQVLFDLEDGFLYTTSGVLSTQSTIPIGALPDLPHQNIWIGDEDNRPVPKQRVGLENLPTFLTTNPFNNFGLYNLYTGQFSVTSLSEVANPITTQRIDLSNMPHLSKGKMWLGIINYTPPIITIDNIPPYVHVSGSLNWSAPGIPPGNGDAVPTEVGLNPGEIFIGDSTPGNEGQITTTLLKIVSNLPDLTYKRIWRGDISNRPVEVNDLTLLEGRVTSAENAITGLQFQIGQLEVQIGGLQFQLGALDTALGLLTLEVQAIATTVGGLVTAVGLLGGTVAALGATVVTLEAQVHQFLTRTLDEIPLAAGDVNLNNHKIINLADPVNPQDAVNLQSMTALTGRTLDQIPLAVADVNLNNHKITNLADPVTSLDAVNLQTLQSSINTGTIASVTGTANQITANTVARDVTVSLPASVTVSTAIGIGGAPTTTLDVFGAARTRRLRGNGNTPTFALGLATTVGTGATGSIVGSELAGRITLTTGTGISTSGGNICVITFPVAFSNTNYPFIISPGSLAAASYDIYVLNSTTTIVQLRGPALLAASTSYIWNYIAIGSI